MKTLAQIKQERHELWAAMEKKWAEEAVIEADRMIIRRMMSYIESKRVEMKAAGYLAVGCEPFDREVEL